MSEFESMPPSSPATVEPPTSPLAIVSLVAGIATWIFLPVIGALTAIITGHIAKNKIRNNAEALKGSGMATAGLILGYLQIVLAIIPICVIVILALLGPAIGEVFSNVVINI